MEPLGVQPPRLRIIVCQAGHGDTLGIEIDKDPPRTDQTDERLRSPSRMFILIDGGPVKGVSTGSLEQEYMPIYSLYKMLNDLVPVGSTGLDTLVATHDDSDHIYGIAELLNRLNDAQSKQLWTEGAAAVARGQAPFNHVWHNSAATMVKNFKLDKKREKHMATGAKDKKTDKSAERDKKRDDQSLNDGRKGGKGGRGVGKDDGGKQKKNVVDRDEQERAKKKGNKDKQDDGNDLKDNYKGYFDIALENMNMLRNFDGEVPTFNGEFQKATTMDRDRDLLKAGFTTTRGHVNFNFISPGDKELQGLAQFFTKHVSTKGDVKAYTEDEINMARKSETPGNLEYLAQNLVKVVKNDQSKKNLSSLVFEVIVPGATPNSVAWSGLFTGDASACQIFNHKREGPGKKWDGTPINYDLIKVGHHGSCHNNFFTKTMIDNAKKKFPKGQTSQNPRSDLPWYPVANDLKLVFTGDLITPDSVEVICLSNVLAYFCNVRAKNYVISASHDMHPNPHLSTIIGIITRAVLFPLPIGEVVNIYLTNPISSLAWNQILTYWCKKERYTTKPMKQGNRGQQPWSLNSKRDYPELCTLLKNADSIGKKIENFATRAIFGLMPHGQLDRRYFQFHYLKRGTSWGAIRTEPVNPVYGRENEKDKEESDAWVAITPYDNWSELYVHEQYSSHFAILGEVPGTPNVPFYQTAEMQSDGSIVVKQVEVPKTPFPSPNYHNNAGDVDKNYQIGSYEHQINLYGNSSKQGLLNSNMQNNMNDGGSLSGNFTVKQMVQNSGNFKMSSMKIEDSPGPGAQIDTYQGARNSGRRLGKVRAKGPLDNEEIIATTRELPLRHLPDQDAPPQNHFDDAEMPNYELFRKFGVDEFEVPTGDDFEGMAQMKIKRLNTFAHLLAYLVDNDKLKVQDAINAGTKFAVDGHPMLGALAYLLLGAEATDAVLRTLPLEFPKSVTLLDDPVQNPVHWPVQLLNVSVVDLDLGKCLKNGSGIQQLTMRILPPQGRQELIWAVPNDMRLLGRGALDLTIKECIDVTIYWPTDSKRRIVHGRFLGSVPTGKNKKHNIVCNWLVMPSDARPVVYNIEFADENFKVAEHEMNILEMLSVFDDVAVDLGLAAADLVLPGLVDPSKPLGNNIILAEAGFTICRDFTHAKALRLDGFFGKFSVDGVPAWTPFSSNAGKSGLEGFLAKIRIPTPSVRLSIHDLFSAQGFRVFFRLNHAIEIGKSSLNYELETRKGSTGERLFEFTFRPTAIDSQEPLSLKELLDTFDLAPLTEADLPDFVSSTLKAVSVTTFRLGWAGKLGVRLPDYMEVGIRVQRLSVAASILDVDNVTFRLRIDRPTNSKARNIYLQSAGVVHIAGVEHVARLKYGVPPVLVQAPAPGARVGPVELAIRTTETPLTLGRILEHFWGKGNNIIPEPFNKITDEVGLTEFVFKTGWSEASKKQVIKVVKLGLAVRKNQIEILEGLTLVEPKLDITAHLPFEKTRTFVVKFSSMVFIDDHSVLINVGAMAGEVAAFAVSMRAGGEGFPVGAFLKFASRQISKAAHRVGFDIPYPEDFGALDRTELDDFTLLIAKGEGGKFGIRQFSISASSDLQLDLWGSASLERVSLEAGYSTEKGFNFTFGAELRIDEHILLTTLGYDVLPKGSGSDTEDGEDKGWFISAEYDGEIDLLAIIRKLVNTLDVTKSISDLNMDQLKTDKDKGIVISNLNITLQKGKSGGGIYISADTDWAIFEHIDFAATYQSTSSWGFCLNMELKDKLLSLVPVDCVKALDEWIEVNDTRVAVYVGKVDTRKAGLKNKKLPPPPGSHGVGPVSAMQAGLTVSTTLKMTQKFGVVQDWIEEGELQLEGHISTQSVGLRAKIPNPIRLLKNKVTGQYDLEIEGWFKVSADVKGVEVGLSANAKIRSPRVSKDLIVLNAGFIINTGGGVGFEGLLQEPLHDLFGVEGLEARGLEVKGVFSVAESGVPEELGMSGGVSLAGTGSTGKLSFYFAQRDIKNCYFYGMLENIDMAAILNFFLKREGLPQVAEEFLGGNIVINKLQLEAALSDIELPKLNKKVDRGFYYEAGLYIKADTFQWSGYTCFEARLSGFQFISMMSPLNFSDSETFLRLRRGTYIPADHSIPTPKGTYDPNMLRDGPIIFISTKNKATPLLISARLTLVGLDVQVDAKGDKSGFDLSVPTANLALALDLSDVGIRAPVHVNVSANGSVRIRPRERAAAQLKAYLNVHNLDLPSVLLSGQGQSLGLPCVTVARASFDLTFDAQIGWPGSGTGFDVILTAKVSALGQIWDIACLSAKMTPEEVDSVAKLAQAAVEAFLEQFSALVRDKLGGRELGEIVAVLRDHLGLAGRELTKAVAILSKKRPEEVLRELGHEVLLLAGIGEDDASRAEILALLGEFYGPQGAIRLVGDMFPRAGMGGGRGGGVVIGAPRPVVELPFSFKFPDIFSSPKIGFGPFSSYGIQTQPEIELPRSSLETQSVDLDDSKAEEERGVDATPNSELSQDDVFTPLSIPAAAQTPVTEVAEEDVVQNAVKQDGEHLAAVEWTPEQIELYVREERIALIGESMDAFGAKEVFEAATELFRDLSEKEVIEYMVIARKAMMDVGVTKDEAVGKVTS